MILLDTNHSKPFHFGAGQFTLFRKSLLDSSSFFPGLLKYFFFPNRVLMFLTFIYRRSANRYARPQRFFFFSFFSSLLRNRVDTYASKRSPLKMLTHGGGFADKHRGELTRENCSYKYSFERSAHNIIRFNPRRLHSN